MCHIMTNRPYPVLVYRSFLVIPSTLQLKKMLICNCVLIFPYIYLKNLIATKIHQDIIVNVLR
jgi:hypothetical protein